MSEEVELPTRLDLGAEWAMLELSSLGLTTPRQTAMFNAFLAQRDFDFGELLEQGIRHKVLPRLARHLLSDVVESLLPVRVRQHLQSVILVHEHKSAVHLKECLRVAEGLKAAGITFSFTKGVVFEQTFLKRVGGRVMNDIDCMIAPVSREAVVRAMLDLGFQMGYFDWASRSVQLDRSTMLKFKLHPDHLPHFTRVLDDPVVPSVAVDFANSMTWTNSPWEVPLEDALAELVGVPCSQFAETIPSLAPSYHFLFTVLHLFREAWFERTIRVGTDVDLAKFSDIYHLYRTEESEILRGGFTALVNRLELHLPVCWVLEHADRVFGSSMMASLGLAGCVSEDWLASARASNGQLAVWRGSMRERLRAKDRACLFSWPELSQGGNHEPGNGV